MGLFEFRTIYVGAEPHFARKRTHAEYLASIYESSVEINFPKLEFQLSIEFSLLLAARPHRVAFKRRYCVPRRH